MNAYLPWSDVFRISNFCFLPQNLLLCASQCTAEINNFWYAILDIYLVRHIRYFLPFKFIVQGHFIERHFIEGHFIDGHFIDYKIIDIGRFIDRTFKKNHRQDISQKKKFINRTFHRYDFSQTHNFIERANFYKQVFQRQKINFDLLETITLKKKTILCLKIFFFLYKMT